MLYGRRYNAQYCLETSHYLHCSKRDLQILGHSIPHEVRWQQSLLIRHIKLGFFTCANLPVVSDLHSQAILSVLHPLLKKRT